MHDLVIRGGTVVDGSGGPPAGGDVAIDGDTITAVGEVTDRGRRELDADGCLVTPGWVDIHTHYDGQATWDPEVSPSGWHGVTTVVMGNCGVGFAPVRAAERDWLVQLMEGVEDIPGAALTEGMTWNWETFPEYLDEVARLPRTLDVAAMVPHGALRAYVLGQGRANDEATADEVATMAKLVRQAVEAGAIGLSTTRTVLHRARDGELAAGTTAPAGELVALGEALAGAGRRVFSVASDLFDLDGEIAWMAEISRRARIPVTYQVLQIDFAPERWRDNIDAGVAANREGAWLVPQIAGRPTSMLVGFESTYHPFGQRRAFMELAGLAPAARAARLRDPAVRAAILDEDGPLTGVEALVFGEPSKLFPLGDPPDYEPDADASVAAIAARRGRPPLEVAYDLMLERDGTELLYRPLLGYAAGRFDALDEMLRHPATVLGLGDGGAHCGVLCDASTPTFMLTHWARDRHRGERLPVEHVVHAQTRRTAALFGLDDRGLLEPGRRADVNVIDHAGLALERPRMVYDLPAGGRRLVQGARGYVATVKAGAVVRENDLPTGERPGRLLRGPQATTPERTA
jgi:N-acyl-D-aspartate/D-glutamate deacylase